MPENDSNADDFIEVVEEDPVTCPRCGSGDLDYRGEGYDNEEYLGAFFACGECGHHFHENDPWLDGYE